MDPFAGKCLRFSSAWLALIWLLAGCSYRPVPESSLPEGVLEESREYLGIENHGVDLLDPNQRAVILKPILDRFRAEGFEVDAGLYTHQRTEHFLDVPVSSRQDTIKFYATKKVPGLRSRNSTNEPFTVGGPVVIDMSFGQPSGSANFKFEGKNERWPGLRFDPRPGIPTPDECFQQAVASAESAILASFSGARRYNPEFRNCIQY